MRLLYKAVLWFVTLFALLVFFVTLYQAFFVASTDSKLFPPSGTAIRALAAGSSVPVRLTVTALSLDAAVQHVTLSKSGSVGTPSNFTDVAWYEYSPVPGAEGNAIIDGHKDNALGLAGVFVHLDQVRVGDDIYVTDGTNQRLHFKVTKKVLLPYNTSDTEEIFGNAVGKNLILITCSGDWNQSIKQYSDRVVVFSTLVK
jgi:LPXTG-site transpeptidase (sortase) family protein